MPNQPSTVAIRAAAAMMAMTATQAVAVMAHQPIDRACLHPFAADDGGSRDRAAAAATQTGSLVTVRTLAAAARYQPG
jgi:hypothetical protein